MGRVTIDYNSGAPSVNPEQLILVPPVLSLPRETVLPATPSVAHPGSLVQDHVILELLQDQRRNKNVLLPGPDVSVNALYGPPQVAGDYSAPCDQRLSTLVSLGLQGAPPLASHVRPQLALVPSAVPVASQPIIPVLQGDRVPLAASHTAIHPALLTQLSRPVSTIMQTGASQPLVTRLQGASAMDNLILLSGATTAPATTPALTYAPALIPPNQLGEMLDPKHMIRPVSRAESQRTEPDRVVKRDPSPHLEEPPKRKKRKYDHESFAQKLHRIVTTLEAEGKGHIMSFLDEGGLWVHEPTVFVEKIMPNYFRGNTWASFRRQLFSYRFPIVKQGRLKGAFTNPLFLRGHPELCERIIRDDKYDKKRIHES